MEEAIEQYVKTNGKPKGTRHVIRMLIVDSTPIQQIHSEVKRQVDTTHVDTNEMLFLLMQESYQYSRDYYDIMNHSKRMRISILRTGIVPDFNRDKKLHIIKLLN